RHQRAAGAEDLHAKSGCAFRLVIDFNHLVGGALVPLNQVSQVWSGNKGSQTNYRLSYQARYIQTQPAVTAGEANASATFVVTYN
ncbi:type 1 fimbrial protein, partial [Klebsiella variicola]|uniref:fimbrial protein n=1 Tax=Klebsiella variicola TaxID=244366 RepID=UPI001561461E